MAAASGSAMAAGFLVRQLMDRGYRAAMDDEPPRDPSKRSTSWPQALAWAAASGAMVSVVQLAAKHGVKSARSRRA